jgi:hypothetical protein
MVRTFLPSGTVSSSAFAPSGAATIHEAIDAGVSTPNDADLATASADVCQFTVNIAPITAPPIPSGHEIRHRSRNGGVGAFDNDVTVTLIENGVDLWTSTPVTLTAIAANYTASIPDVIAASITDYTALSVRYDGTLASARLPRVFEVELRVPDAIAYSVAGGTGGFSLSGVAAGLTSARSVPAEVGAFSLSGIAAGLTSSRTIPADVGAFSLSGNDAAFTAQRLLAAGVGSFALNGIDAALSTGRSLSADTGAFALTGIDAAIVYARVLLTSTGAFVLDGPAVVLTTSGEEVPGFSSMLAVADAIVSELNAGTWTKSFTSERVFTADIRIEEKGTLIVLVRGVSEKPRTVARGKKIKDVVIEIFATIRFPSTEDRAVPTNADIDPYVEFLEELAGHFDKARLADIPAAFVESAKSLPSYDEKHLAERLQWTGVVSLEVADWR